jgi:hypothetical protein
MDSEAFDRLARRLGTPGTRRAALAALLGAVATLPASSPLRAGNRKRNRKRKGKGKKGRGGTVLVCHSGETLRVPRYAVRAIKLAGGFVGACPPGGQPPGSGAGACVQTAVVCRQGRSFHIQCEGDGCNESTGGTTNCPIAHRCTTNGDCGPRQYCELRLNGCCGPQRFRTGLCARTCQPPPQ